MDCELSFNRVVIFANTNSYPYPLFEQLDTVQRIVLFTGAAALMTGSTAVLQSFYKLVNGIDQEGGRSTPLNVKEE